MWGSIALERLQRLDTSDDSTLDVYVRSDQFEQKFVERVLEHFDAESGGIRHNLAGKPSLYGEVGFFFAIERMAGARDGSLTLKPSREVKQKIVHLLGADRFHALQDFTRGCRTEEAYSEYPGGAAGTITCHAGLLAERYLDLPTERPQTIHEYLLRNLKQPTRGEGTGFCLSEGYEPDVWATHFGLRALIPLNAALSPASPSGRKLLNAHRDPIARFLKRCKVEGGFAQSPDGGPASIVFTRLALKTLIELRVDITEVMSANEVVNLVRTRIEQGAVGFTLSNSNILGLRDAAELLLMARDRSDGINLREETRALREMVLSHIDPTTAMFVGYRLTSVGSTNPARGATLAATMQQSYVQEVTPPEN